MELYKHSVYTRYYSPPLSIATFFVAAIYLLSLCSPFFMAYSTYGFWMKESTYWEQPIIQYEHKLAILVESSSGLLAFSTIPEFNKMAGFSNVRIPQVQSFSDDPNLDGRMDFFNMSVTLALNDNEDVYGVSALVFFHARLQDRVKLEMTSLAYIHRSSNLPGSSLQANGNLRFNQLYPLSTRGSRTEYAGALLDSSTITSIEDTQFPDILSNYFERNETLSIHDETSYWMPGRGEEFQLKLRFRVPKSSIRYIPPPGEVLKFSWMQYVAVGVIIFFLADLVLYFAFAYGLLDSRRVVDNALKEHHF